MTELVVLLFIPLASVGFALASVLLLKFWAGGLSQARRTVGGIAGGCLGPSVLFIAIVLVEGGYGSLETLAILAITSLPFALICWPVSHFATRKLDKLTENSASVFE